MKLESCRQILETYSILIFMKIPPAEPGFSMRNNGRTDRQTDMKELIVASRNFANAPKNNCFDVQCVYLAQHSAQKNDICSE